MPGYVIVTTTVRRPDFGADTPTAALGQNKAKIEDKCLGILPSRRKVWQQTVDRKNQALPQVGNG